jgi:membrane protein
MPINWRELVTRAEAVLWDTDLATAPPIKAQALKYARILYVTVQELVAGELTLRAMSLVYTTLLSLVPLLALSFSVLKAFGVHNQLEPFLLNFLAPLSDKASEITNRIIGFVENIRVGLLGSIGLGLLIYTVISLIHKIELSFNTIWHIEGTRSFTERFSGYLSVLLVGPLLVFSAFGVGASLMSSSVTQQLMEVAPLATVIETLGKLIPHLLIIAALTFVYVLIPHTKVRIGSALTGAVVSGLLGETTGWAFAKFIASSTGYAAIYSSFAIAILFMIWLYLCWLILLVGAVIAFYAQHPEYLGASREPAHLSHRVRERLALLIMYLIGQHYWRNRASWTQSELSSRLGVPLQLLCRILDDLDGCGLILKTCEQTPGYVPARDLDTITVADVLAAIRRAGEGGRLIAERIRSEGPVDEVLAEVERAMDTAVEGRTLKKLISGVDPNPPGEANALNPAHAAAVDTPRGDPVHAEP